MFHQHAVDAEADAVELFKRFEVQVGSAEVDGVHQHLVEEAHHRRVLDFVGGVVGGGAGNFLFLGELDFRFVAGQVGNALFAALVEARQQLQQRVVCDDYRFDGGFGLELDLVQRLRVGRIGNRH